MVFNVTPDQIARLDSKQLVELLRRLLHAEARDAGVELSGVSVPLKITVPDGGEDGRVAWSGGVEKTDYLLARFCLFQSKASNLSPAGWAKEVWTKSTQRKGKKKKLNQAIVDVLAAKGVYIAFTNADIVQRRVEEIKTAIREAIKKANGAVKKLAAIEVYNAERIASWCTKHPAVAVWVNENQTGLSLKGFQSVERWGQREEFLDGPAEDKKARYVLETTSNATAERAANALTAEQAHGRIQDELKRKGSSIRIFGPSGVGKSRFIYNLVSRDGPLEASSQKAISLFCDYRDVASNLNATVAVLVESETSAILIVDECPRDTAIHLSQIVAEEKSRIQLITIGLDDRAIDLVPCLNLSVDPSTIW